MGAPGNLYFAKVAGLPKPPQYYYDWAGSLGGPVVKNKTFFWASLEGYQQKSTRNNVLTLPTALERQGDFSQTRDAQGRLVVLYDPLTTRADPNNPGQFIRDPFPGNKIPLNRLNPVAVAMLAGMPIPASGKSFNGNATLLDGPQSQGTFKLDQHWSDRWTTSGTFARQHTQEPGSTFYGDFGTAPGDPAATKNNRLIYFFALNNTLVPNNTTTLAVRYGYNHFDDFGGYYRDSVRRRVARPAVGLRECHVLQHVPENHRQRLRRGADPRLHGTEPGDVRVAQRQRDVVEVRRPSHGQGWGSSIAAWPRTPSPTAIRPATSGSRRPSPRDRTRIRPAPSPATPSRASCWVPGDRRYRGGRARELLPELLRRLCRRTSFRATSKLTFNLGLRYEFEDGLQRAGQPLHRRLRPHRGVPGAGCRAST